MPSKQDVLKLALEAAVTGDSSLIHGVFTEDVSVWSPTLSVSSREELQAAYAERETALSNPVIVVVGLDTVGDKAIAEWVVAADHTGPLTVDEDLVVEATGRRLELAGATFAEFRGDKICAVRSYFDDAALLEQMLIEP
jgi:ketosteroid isomerase-like protein